MLSTLLPRLTHHRLHAFRWALLGGAILVVGLSAVGLVAPALWIAVFLVPAAYLAYLRQVDVYADAPLLVLLATVVAGAAVGVVLTVVGDQVGHGKSAGSVLLLVVALAVLAELLKPVLPLALLRGRFPATVDGLVFGVAAGVGFAMAEAVVNLSGALGGLGFRVAPANWTFTLLSLGLLVPLLHGSCSGLVAASLWRRRGGHDAALRAAGLPLALIADAAFVAGSEVLDDAALSPLLVLLWQALAVAGVLVAVRMLLHAAVLDEGAALGLREVRCHACGRTVEAASFCPHCGASLHAGSAAAPALGAAGIR